MTTVNFTDILTTGFDEDALTGKQVVNFGDLTTTGDLANGFFADADDVSFRNFGAIETSGLGAAGIFVQGQNTRIENFGSVHTTGDFFGDFAFFSEGIFAEGNNYYIANHGSIQTEGEASSAMIGLGADGLIINFGRVNSSSDGGAAVFAIGDRSQVINVGQMTVSGAFTSALRVEGEDTNALNRGEILITGPGGVGIAGAGFDVLTNRGDIITNADDSFGVLAFGDSNQVSNFGLIETKGTFAIGIMARGAGSVLGLDNEIVNEGHIVTDGDLAVGVALGIRSDGFRPAADGEIVNRGVISTHGDGAAGVVMAGDGHHLTNGGTITTNGGAFDAGPLGILHAAGVVVVGDGAMVENAGTGIIQSLNADSAAVELNIVERPGLLAAGTSSTLENFGLIEGAVAVLGGDGQETVINHGTVVGDVVLGDGADTFVFGKGGNLAGNLFLGAGDDLVIIENGAGTTHIADFEEGFTGNDVIDVSAFFSSFEELLARSVQSGNDVVVTLDHNDTLIIENVQLLGGPNPLNAGDFDFIA